MYKLLQLAVTCTLGLAACGRIAYDRLPEAGEGTPGTDAGIEQGSPDAGPFGVALEIAELNTFNIEDDPTLTADMLEIYFERGNPAGDQGDLWRASRASLLDPWDAPELVVELNSADRDSTPEIVGDGLTIYFTSSRGSSGTLLDGLDVFVATRPDRSSAWGNVQLVTELSSPLGDTAPVLSADGLSLVMSSARDAGDTGLGISGLDLFTSTRSTTSSPWQTPTPIAELNTDVVDDSAVFLDPLTLLYVSERPGSEEQDMYLARRPSITEPFGAPEPLAELNTSLEDTDPWVSPDGQVMIFSSDRDGARDLYVVSR
jgi:hypothetical protein